VLFFTADLFSNLPFGNWNGDCKPVLNHRKAKVGIGFVLERKIHLRFAFLSTYLGPRLRGFIEETGTANYCPEI
jgi:hypothetical protein